VPATSSNPVTAVEANARPSSDGGGTVVVVVVVAGAAVVEVDPAVMAGAAVVAVDSSTSLDSEVAGAVVDDGLVGAVSESSSAHEEATIDAAATSVTRERTEPM